VVIGSRYLPQSQIIGWPISRIFFSKVINFIIPKLLSLEITDVTNGLRRYSKNAIALLLEHPQYNTGFIYLTEQLLHINNSHISIEEIPIVFRNRSLGKSSVTFKEVLASILGLLTLWVGYKSQRFLKIFSKIKK
jgi:dolichol-phosphate mannosyltransferase